MTDRREGEWPVRVGVCLSLSGRYARFGRQAALALETWQSMRGGVELLVEDDESSPRMVEARLPRVASRCDVLLGPYSTRLMKAAGRVAADEGLLLWNHGGSGDDVEGAHPGHIVSVLTPTSRYAEPFLRRLAAAGQPNELWIAHGKGSFGKQVAAGAIDLARRLRIGTVRLDPQGTLPSSGPWSLLCAGQFEEDVELVQRVQAHRNPPRKLCAVAAGVREFGEAVGNTEGIFGIAQWFPGGGRAPVLGPAEEEFLAAYSVRVGVTPDYPAVQAVAGAVIAAHCARVAEGTSCELLWPVAATLDTDTLFGGYAIDPVTGVQTKHETTLIRWTADGPVTVPPTPAQTSS